jgi:hypothetical protein
MPTYLPQQAQKFIITQQSAGVKMRTQDVNSIHHFVMNTALDMNEFGVSYSNIYNNFSVLYPLIGTTSDSHKFNLVNPSISITNNLTYQGVPTQSDGYIQLSGINSQWIDTNFDMSSLGINNFHTSYYSIDSTSASGVDILIRGVSNGSLEFSLGNTAGSGRFGVAEFASPSSLSTAYISWDTSYGLFTFAKNGVSLNTYGLKADGIFSSYSIASWISSMIFTGNLIIGSSSNIVEWDINTTKRSLGLLSIGTSLTSEQSKSYTNAANKLISNKGIVTYATLNPLRNGVGATLTNNNLTYTGKNITLSNVGVSSGKWYCEATLLDGIGNWGIGVVNNTATNSAPWNSIVNWNSGVGYENNLAGAGMVGVDLISTPYGSYITSTASIIGIFMDLNSRRVRFSANGVTFSNTPTNIGSGTYYIAVGAVNTGYATASFTMNFGQSPFVYANTVPSDYNLGLYNGTKGPY